MSKPTEPNKVKAHQRYYTKSGVIVPGVTTITGELGWAKNALVKWANNLGLQGIDSNKYVDDKANVGTLAHLIVTNYLQGYTTDHLKEYSKETLDRAENSFLSFLEWEKQNKIRPILIEEPLVSEVYQYGGQIDIYGEINGELEIVDLKTGNGIYSEHIVQVSAYKVLLEEAGHRVDRLRILNIPRTEDESFAEKKIDNWQTGFEIFKRCLEIYRLKKELTK